MNPEETEALRFEDASTQAHFAAMSAIHCRGWHSTYPGHVPDDYLREEVTEERWVPVFRAGYETGGSRGLLLYAGERPVACCTYGPARRPDGAEAAPGRGEIISFYAEPACTGRGYGSRLMEEALRRLKAEGYGSCELLVLRENTAAQRFYRRHGFAWDGSSVDIPVPGGAVCVDLRFVRTL